MMTAEVSKGAFAEVVVAGAWFSLIREIISSKLVTITPGNSEVLPNCTKFQGYRFQEGRGLFRVILEMLIYRTISPNIDFLLVILVL